MYVIFWIVICSRPRTLVARVYYVKSLPTWNKDYLSIYITVGSGQGDELHALYIPLSI